jgi:hypothetical protein
MIQKFKHIIDEFNQVLAKQNYRIDEELASLINPILSII